MPYGCTRKSSCGKPRPEARALLLKQPAAESQQNSHLCAKPKILCVRTFAFHVMLGHGSAVLVYVVLKPHSSQNGCIPVSRDGVMEMHACPNCDTATWCPHVSIYREGLPIQQHRSMDVALAIDPKVHTSSCDGYSAVLPVFLTMPQLLNPISIPCIVILVSVRKLTSRGDDDVPFIPPARLRGSSG